MPASIANLGPGFDLLAMAVDLWLEVEAEPAAAPDWVFVGEGASILSAAPNPLSRLPMKGVVRSEIPLGVGLGSSAAARLAAGFLSTPEQPHVDFQRLAAEQEGHPDNVAAALQGGLVLILGDQRHPLPTPDLEVALLVAGDAFPTEEARAVVPTRLSREDAVFNGGRMALFTQALHSKRWGLLAAAMEDRIHQPYRYELFPWVKPVLTAARYAGAHGAALSGAGPSVFAFCDRGRGEQVAAAMADAAQGKGRPLVTRVSPKGMSWLG